MNMQDISTDLGLALDRQRAAHAADPFPSWADRAERLKRLLKLLTEHEDALAAAIDTDFGGRPAIETELAEVWPALEAVKGALRHGKGWMKPRSAGVGKWFQPASAQVMPVPLGVVGVIVPWNYPLYLSIAPLAAALAAGNRVMLKLSEMTPAFGQLFKSLCAESFAADELAVFIGDANEAAQFSALPFDHLLFTGSTHVGRKVMAAAAVNLTPVTLELGGKSPAIIAPGYPLAHAVERIMVAKLINAGQTCIAPDYVLLPRAQMAEFVAQARQQVQRGYPSSLSDENYCSIINPRQYNRLLEGLKDAGAKGARCEQLFEAPTREPKRQRLGPVLLIDPSADCTLMQDEIFGPLLPLVPYDSIEEAMAFVNARPKPLALYWFDHDAKRVEVALQTIPAGGVTVNDTLLHIAQDSLPFGGVGSSGMGHYHGRWGFDTFSKLKPVFRQARVNGMALFLPPYKPMMRRLLRLMKRF